MNKIAILFLILLVPFACKKIDEELANTCNPAFIFKEKDKEKVNFSLIGDFVFQPYCSPCHSTSDYQFNNSSLRIGYLPLDDKIKIELSANQQFLTEFSKYINHDNPEESILVKAVQDGDVLRADKNGYIRYREPRFNCYLPDDFVKGLIWWIENAEGKTENLFK